MNAHTQKERAAANKGFSVSLRGIASVLVVPCIGILLVCAVLAYITQARLKDLSEHEAALAHAVTTGTSEELSVMLRELQRSVHLFAGAHATLLQQIKAHPDDTNLQTQMTEEVRHYFPESFAWTIANADGVPAIVDFDGLVGDVCQKDLTTFAHDRRHSEVYLHPSPEMYHFDIMVDAEDNGASGIFFVSFDAKILARMLARSELPGYQLLLINRDIKGLIEVGSQGSRISLQRPFMLSSAEVDSIRSSAPVVGARWDLAVLPDMQIVNPEQTEITRDALVVGGAFIAAMVMVCGLLVYLEVRKQRLRYQHTHDPVTGLPNRYFLLEMIQKRLSGVGLCKTDFLLALIEVNGVRQHGDGFFRYHENQGLVSAIANALRGLVAERVFVSHLGERQFGLLIPVDRSSDLPDIDQLSEMLRKELLDSHKLAVKKIHVGLADYPGDAANMEELVRIASSNLYAARISSS